MSVINNIFILPSQSANLANKLADASKLLPQRTSTCEILAVNNNPELAAVSDTSIEIKGDCLNTYPDPVRTNKHIIHPKLALFGITDAGSYLNRHKSQMQEFRDHILPLIIDKKISLGDKKIRLAVVGPGFEEQATILSSLREAFANNSAWGKIEDWDIKVDGYERSLPVLLESVERINGRSPFFYSDKEASGQVMKNLNQAPAWASQSFRSFLADAKMPETITLMKNIDYDAVFMNAVFDDILEPDARALAGLFSTLDAFFIGDESQDAPIRYLGNHDLEYRIQVANFVKDIKISRHEKDYAIAIPKSYQAAWQANNTQRPKYQAPENIDKPGLRLLVIESHGLDPSINSTQISSRLRDNIGCWSNKNSMRNAVVDDVLIDRGQTIRNLDLAPQAIQRIKDGYYHGIIINGFQHDIAALTQYAFLLRSLNQGMPVITVTNDPTPESELTRLKKLGFIPVDSFTVTSEAGVTPYIDNIAHKAGISTNANNADGTGSPLYGLGHEIGEMLYTISDIQALDTNLISFISQVKKADTDMMMLDHYLFNRFNQYQQNYSQVNLDSFRDFIKEFPNSP